MKNVGWKVEEHTYIHSYIHTYIHPYIHTSNTSIHPYIHTSIHPYIHTSIHPYIHTYIHECKWLLLICFCLNSEELSIPNSSTSASGIQTFRFGQDLQFEVYIQYKEYMCFVKCMEALRGMKLMHISKDSKALTANIKVPPYFF